MKVLMLVLIIVFTALFAACVIARFVFPLYIDAVPAFSALQTPMIWLSVVFGAVAAALIITVIIKALRK